MNVPATGQQGGRSVRDLRRAAIIVLLLGSVLVHSGVILLACLLHIL